MTRKRLQKIGALIWFSGFVVAQAAFAQSGYQVGGSGGSNAPITLPNPISAMSFTTVVANVTNFLITAIAIPLTAIMALIGGFQMVTAAGNPEKFASGRKTLMYAAVGFVVVILASSIVAIIRSIFS